MFRNTRVLHRWIGILGSLFMVLMACTGLLLAVKKQFSWIQPPTRKGEAIAHMGEVAPLSVVADAVFAAGIPELARHEDFDRFELHVDKRVFKVTSKRGYREVQVDARTGKVLSTGQRNDQMVEQIHDLSFFGAKLHDVLLPIVALCLLTLGLTGIYMFFVPVFRRWQFRRRQAFEQRGG